MFRFSNGQLLIQLFGQQPPISVWRHTTRGVLAQRDQWAEFRRSKIKFAPNTESVGQKNAPGADCSAGGVRENAQTSSRRPKFI